VAEWHLDDLEQRLLERGWALVRETRWPLEERTTGTWEIARGERRLHIDFDGIGDPDGLVFEPPERGYGCDLREARVSLHFRRHRNEHWLADVRAFVAALDDASTFDDP
jgi:hypothetical protein